MGVRFSKDTPERNRKLGAKGGKASGKARRRKIAERDFEDELNNLLYEEELFKSGITRQLLDTLCSGKSEYEKELYLQQVLNDLVQRRAYLEGKIKKRAMRLQRASKRRQKRPVEKAALVL